LEQHGEALDTPVDMHWWLSFFHHGKRCGRLDGEALFRWRQHPRQHTRTHGRLSIESLRRIKVHFLFIGPLASSARIVVVSVGATLKGWLASLREHPAAEGKDIVGVVWCPAKSRGRAASALPPAKLPAEAVIAPGGEDSTVRLWAFGSKAVRDRVVASVRDFQEFPQDILCA
jgi:hypothetical protein